MTETKKQSIDPVWDTEPNHEEFWFEGIRCVLHRSPTFKTWCGYAGIAPEHYLFGVEYAQGSKPGSYRGSPEDLFSAHGGLTYSGKGVPLLQPWVDSWKDLWFFGFDCNHMGDFVPGSPSCIPYPEYYKTIDFVCGQVKSLALQLALADRLHKVFTGASDIP